MAGIGRNDLRVVEVLGGSGGGLDDLLQRRHHPRVGQRLPNEIKSHVVSLSMCTGACRYPATCGTNQGDRKRRFAPPLRGGRLLGGDLQRRHHPRVGQRLRGGHGLINPLIDQSINPLF